MERGQQWRHLMDLWTEADLQWSSLSLVPHGFGETVTAMEKCLRHTHIPGLAPVLPGPASSRGSLRTRACARQKDSSNSHPGTATPFNARS